MSLLACGLNYKTTPIEMREKFIFSREEITSVLKGFVSETKINEAVILSTCNRTEIYTKNQNKESITEWIWIKSNSCFIIYCKG